MGLLDWSVIILSCAMSAFMVFAAFYTYPQAKHTGQRKSWLAFPILALVCMAATYVAIEQLYRPY